MNLWDLTQILNLFILRDIWPSMDEIQSVMNKVLDSKDFISNYESIFHGDEKWEVLQSTKTDILSLG